MADFTDIHVAEKGAFALSLVEQGCASEADIKRGANAATARLGAVANAGLTYVASAAASTAADALFGSAVPYLGTAVGRAVGLASGVFGISPAKMGTAILNGADYLMLTKANREAMQRMRK